MGIQGFNQLFKEQCPEAYGFIPLENLRGRRIAIDAGNLGYRWYAGAVAQVIDMTDIVRDALDSSAVFRSWLVLSLSNIKTWMRFGITPVLVFDGTAPIEKQEEQARRREGRQKTQEDMVAVRAQLDAMDFVDRNSEVVLRYKSMLKKVSAPSNEEKDQFRIVMETLGIPCVTSMGDGESLCSMMAIDGIVHGVYSTDTDCLVYGCPCLISDVSMVQNKMVASSVLLERMLTKLGWTFAQFVDMCIMMSCDYNTNIPKIGPKRALKLIEDYKSIDRIPDKLDKTPLKHVRCRELFAYRPAHEVVDHTKVSRTLVRLLRAETEAQPDDASSSSSIGGATATVTMMDAATLAADARASVPIMISSLADLSHIDEGAADDLVFNRSKRLALAVSALNPSAPPHKRRIILTPSMARGESSSSDPQLTSESTRRALHSLEIDVDRFRLVGQEILDKYNCGGQFRSFLEIATVGGYVKPRSLAPFVLGSSGASSSASASSSSDASASAATDRTA